MSKSMDALTAFLAKWEALKAGRPAEGDFGTYGYPLSYASMDELFSRWEQTLSALDAKGYWATSPEVGIADAPLAAQLNNLSSLVASAVSNGVSWLLGVQFLDVAHNVQLHLSVLARRQASLNKEVTKLLLERSAGDFELVIGAANAAQNVLELDKQAESDARRIAEASGAVDAANSLASETNDRLTELARQAEESASVAASKQKELERILKAALDRVSQPGGSA